MRVIPVLDLMAGRAVRAEGGRREGYAPVHSVLLPEERAGDALALAGAFRDRLGRDEWYVGCSTPSPWPAAGCWWMRR